MKILKITVLSLFVFGCASLDKLKPSAEQIDIDGSSDDWPNMVHFDKETGIEYRVTYDKKNLYVLAKVYEEDAIQRIVSSGLTVWVDSNGKKKKTIGIKYPIIEGAPGKGRGRSEPNRSRELKLDESQLDNMMVQGIFSDEMQIVQKNQLKIDLDVMIGFDSIQNLLYELKIPLVLLEQKVQDGQEKLAIGFEVSDPVRPPQVNGSSGERGNRSGRGGNQAGGMSRSGGGSGGARGGGSPSGSQSMTSNQSLIFWYHVEL